MTPQNSLEWKLIAAWEDLEIPEVMSLWSGLSDEKKIHYNAKFEKLRKGYPLDYLLPYTVIREKKFILNKSVLIPRPETEELIDIISHTDSRPEILVDVGTGSGFISILLSQYFREIIASDVSRAALETAQKNVFLNSINNINIVESNLFKSIELPTDDYWLVANLPYVPLEDKSQEKELNTVYEPDLAIYSGKDGLNLTKEFLSQLQNLDQKPSKVFMELDPRNIVHTKEICDTILGFESSVIQDNNDLNRFLVITKR